MIEEDSHVPFMLVKPINARKKFRIFNSFADFLPKLFPNIKQDLESAYMPYKRDDYLLASFLSSIIPSLIFSGLIYSASYYRDSDLTKALLIGFGSFLAITLLIFFYFAKTPSFRSARIAADIDKHLIFALKDLMLQTSSGSSLFNSIVSVSEAGYGRISNEFAIVARQINAGTPTDLALENLVKRTHSDYLKKVMWQIINTIRAGASLKIALDNILADLTNQQRANIVNYANELNLWSLIYMLFAVAVPTIGLTMMIILSSFADIGISEATLVIFVASSMIVQLIIIALIKSRRPQVEF